ncbi:MAG: DUF2808 domain-containing protein [Leptolyngbyaceae bacterium]|nr:DUF2808 domain-containing protein [Leptolyngbyaceae bacterium]
MNHLTRLAIATTTLSTIGLSTIGISTIGMSAIGFGTAQAVQFSDGTVHFENPPRLIDSAIREQSVSDNNVKYFFLLSVPEDAGEPLQRIEIVQEHGDLFTREIDFDPEDSVAYIGHRRSVGEELTIGTSDFNDDTNTMSLTFDPPIPPGTDLTIRLNAERNPRRSGVYLMGVTAYPEGTEPSGQFLGFGRFHIFDSDNDFFR